MRRHQGTGAGGDGRTALTAFHPQKSHPRVSAKAVLNQAQGPRAPIGIGSKELRSTKTVLQSFSRTSV